MAKGNVPSPAVAVAKEKASLPGVDDVYTLSTGVRARLIPVAASLIDEVTARVPDPEIPVFKDENKGVEEENPSDPRYLKALADAERQRGIAGTEAVLLFGIELVDPVPTEGPAGTWLRKLAYLGFEVDVDDPFALELAYKKYVAVSSDDLIMIGRLSGIPEEAVEAAARSFRGEA